MSAWPEAAWIVKKLQANFDFTNSITLYTQNLNRVDTQVNALNLTVQADKEIIDGLDEQLLGFQQQINKMASTIKAKKVNGQPEGYDSSNYTNGTIWLIET